MRNAHANGSNVKLVGGVDASPRTATRLAIVPTIHSPLGGVYSTKSRPRYTTNMPLTIPGDRERVAEKADDVRAIHHIPGVCGTWICVSNLSIGTSSSAQPLPPPTAGLSVENTDEGLPAAARC